VSTEPSTVSNGATSLEDVVLAYLEAADAGAAPAPEELVARHPHLAVELKAFFADQEFLAPLVAPLRTPAPTAAPPPKALSFGDYEVLGEIDRAGMGVVYRARRVSLNKVVALKMIRDDELASPDDVQRFHREAENVAALDHPNIVPIYDFGEHEGRPFFSMKLVEGGSLAQHVRRFAGKPRDVARLMEIVARAVHYAHQRGILHRDLKPANILLEITEDTEAAEKGQEAPSRGKNVRAASEFSVSSVVPMVADFGLARRLDGVGGLPASGVIEGTIPYMAPEQTAGTKGLSTAADVYGLGAVLYELLTGRRPFQGANPLEVLSQVREKEPAAPRGIDRKVNRDLEVICLKCLHKQPAKRYGSAQGLADDLRRFTEGRPIKARRVRWPERAAKWARRRPAVAALLTATVLLALLGGAGVGWKWWEAETALQKVNAELYRSRINRADGYITARQNSLADKELDECPEALRGFEWYYLKRLCRRNVVVLPGEDVAPNGRAARVRGLQYSPDGRLLATASADGRVNVWDPIKGRLLWTRVGHSGPANAVCFCAQRGRLLVVSAGEDQAVRVWEADGGKKIQELPGAGSLMAGSRDGRRIASAGFGQSVALRQAVDGSDEVFRKDPGGDIPLGKTSALGLAMSPDGRYLAACGGEAMVQVWDLEAHEQLPLPAADDAARLKNVAWAIAFSPDGALLAAASFQPVVWDLKAPSTPRSFPEPGDLNCAALAFSPDGNLLAGTYRDGLVRVWDAHSGMIVVTRWKPEGHDLVAFSPGDECHPGGQYLALTRRQDVTIEEIDPEPTPRSRVLSGGGPKQDAWGLAFGPDGRLASRADDEVTFWDVDAGASRPTARVKMNAAAPPGANLTFVGNDRLFCGRDGGPLWEWDTAEGKHADPAIPAKDVRSCAANGEGQTLATTDGGGGVTLWDLANGSRRLDIRVGSGKIQALAFRPHGRQLASCGSGGAVTLWNADDGAKVRTFSGHTSMVTGVSFSPDGARMATCGADLTVRVWDPENGEKPLFTLRGHIGSVAGVAFSPVGPPRIASCGTDGLVKLWDAERGQELLTLTGHGGPVQCVAFSPDGRLLATCSRDGTVRVWDARPIDD
jgi:WD40 repeat protein